MIRSAQVGAIALLFFFVLGPLAVLADSSNRQAQSAPPATDSASPTIVVGFRGSLFHERAQGFRNALAEMREDGIHTELVYNGWMDRLKAEHAIAKWLDTNGDGNLSEEEKQQARIILIGHSWGVPSEIAFARELKRQNIPVALMIEIDAVVKPWLPDETVPVNVKEAVNFYEGQGLFLLRGSSKIAAADSADTQIMGNIKMSYDRADVPKCRDYSFILRALNRYHIGIECDPHVWSRIESMVSAWVSSGTSQMQKPSDIEAAQ